MAFAKVAPNDFAGELNVTGQKQGRSPPGISLNRGVIWVKFHSAVLLIVSLLLAGVGAHGGELANSQYATSSESMVSGQVLLPGGSGSRGVEILISVTGADGDARTEWVLFDKQGRFTHRFLGNLTAVRVTAGIEAEVYKAQGDALPEIDQAGEFNLGVIDLRDRLSIHRMVLRAEKGKPQGEVRVGMWFGLPPVGPQGEPVSLGSRQFPPVTLGSEIEWLLAHEARSIYFLVERPSGSGRGTDWRSGPQWLFGPHSSAEIPSELVID